MTSHFIEHTLPNGLRVVVEQMPNVSSAALGFFVRTGSRHETRPEHGVSHFLEHMCFKGTAKRDWREINVRFDELGSIYNAFTGKEHTVYYGWVPSDRFEPQLELLADMMRPSIPAADFETERNVILEEIAMSGDSFDHHVWNFLHETVFGEHPLAHEILGEKETIAGLPRDIMLNYRDQRYAASNMTLIASGSIDAEALFAATGRYCGGWARTSNGHREFPTPAPLTTGVRKHKLDQFKQQTVILLYPSVPHGSDDAENIETFSSLFGGPNSRCYWNIVQKGICSQAGAAWLSYGDYGMLALYGGGEPENCDAMIDALRKEATSVMKGGFTAEEVQRVKNRRRTQLAMEAENPRTRFMQLVDDLETTGTVLSADARMARVEAVTPKSIARHLEKYPITGEGLLLSCGPRDWPA
ncbi:MAG: M16 family metallopeptidase [Phycisphaerae bacterium]